MAAHTTDGVRFETDALYIDNLRLPYRTVEVDDETLKVPRGIGRNARNKSWQIKLNRNGMSMITGNVADGDTKPSASLEKAIKALIEKVREEKVLAFKRGTTGKRARPVPIADGITMHWKLVNTTPVLYFMVYSPQIKKAKQISVGSERAVANAELVKERLAEAIVYRMRIDKKSPAPFAAIDKTSSEYRDGLQAAMGVMAVFSTRFHVFAEQGASIRRAAEEQRARSLADMGLSELASRTLRGRRA